MSEHINVYTIDSGVPIPTGKSMPLGQLEVGESILFPLVRRASIQTLTSRLKKETGKEFTIKKQSAGTARVWRTK